MTKNSGAMATSVEAPGRTGTDPFSPGMQKLAASSGILFAVSLVLTILLGSATTPDESDPVADWTAFAADNDSKLAISALIMLFGAYWMLWFGAFLRSVLGAAEQAARGFVRVSFVALIGAAVGAAGLVLGTTIAALAVSLDDTPPEIIRSVTALSGAGFALSSVGFAAMLFATMLANGRLGVLPKWLGIVALVGGLSFLLQNLVVLDEDSFAGIFYPLAWLMLFVFCIGASVAFLGSLRHPPPAP